nr:HAD-IA family hydrolase [Nocardioides insulae]
MDWRAYGAVLFDLDGVITPTAVVHRAAWSEMFTSFLAAHGARLAGGPVAPYAEADYFAHVDGKPRYDGVRDFLASRGIRLPEGTPSDPAGSDGLSVRSLGDAKNAAFNAVLERDGVTPYPGSVLLLDHLASLGLPLAVVSSSANAPAVLTAAGLLDRFGTVVDGRVATELGLPGKPAPDTFVHAATVLDTSPGRAVVLEDAVSGVAAGASGDFGLVIGVDRGAGPETLLAAGAHLVVADLADLAPSDEH